MLRLNRAALPLLLLVAGCESSPYPLSGVEEIRRAQLLAQDDSLPGWPAADANRPVLLYVDRSQSMRGFLDPDYPTKMPTDYRSVLDGFAARLKPARVFGFGNEVREAPDADLGVLGNPEFYFDGNTELEEVLARVRADSALDGTHVIIGDGRRGNPNSANGQFVRMRSIAEQWTAAGGSFIVAASHAPFKPVASDASGCSAPDSADASGGGRTCPLYAFAFVAPGDQRRVATTLAATFEDLFVTPLPALAPADVRLSADRGANGITLQPGWTQNARGARIARVGGPVAINQPLRATIVAGDTMNAAWAALRGRRLVPRVSVRPLAENPAAAPWTASANGGLLTPAADDPLAMTFVTRGDEAPPYLYRVDLLPAGGPSWLAGYDAETAADGRRTFALGRLFEGFNAADPAASAPVVRIYAVVN